MQGGRSQPASILARYYRMIPFARNELILCVEFVELNMELYLPSISNFIPQKIEIPCICQRLCWFANVDWHVNIFNCHDDMKVMAADDSQWLEHIYDNDIRISKKTTVIFIWHIKKVAPLYNKGSDIYYQRYWVCCILLVISTHLICLTQIMYHLNTWVTA